MIKKLDIEELRKYLIKRKCIICEKNVKRLFCSVGHSKLFYKKFDKNLFRNLLYSILKELNLKCSCFNKEDIVIKDSYSIGKLLSLYEIRPKYRVGHKNKGIKYNMKAQHKRKISKALLGIRRSENTKRKMSESKKGVSIHTLESKTKLRIANLGKKSCLKGIIRSNHVKQKISNSLKKYYKEHSGIKRSEETKKKLRIARLNRVIPKQDTKPEVCLQKKLIDLKIKFITHKNIFGQPDIFIEPNICIFVDGCYWHGCRNCGFINPHKYFKDNYINQKLIEDNYRVLRFWEHEIYYNIDNVVDKIIQNLKQYFIQ